MTNEPSDASASTTSEANARKKDVSLIPAILAGSALLLMIFLVVCAVGTWFLFSQQAELAGRTLRGTMIPMVEQSTLAPEEKGAVIEELELVAEQCEAEVLESWQAGGIMQRLRMLPIVQWGDLDTLVQMARNREWAEEEIADVRRQVSRVQKGIANDDIRATDIDLILEPVTKPVDDLRDRVLDFSITDEQLRDTVYRLKLVADDAKVPDEDFDVRLIEIVRDKIAAGKSEGAI